MLQPDNWDEVNSFDIIADVNANNNPNRVAKDLHKYRFSGEGGQLFDVTDELDVGVCSITNPADCKTAQQCNSLGQVWIDNHTCNEGFWDGSTCTAVPCIPE